MSTVVTIGIPVYKRLHCLPHALQSVASQDYPHIELIVSDNGKNGNKVKEILQRWYPRPFRFRQNVETVRLAQHYNQIIQEASGEYFATLDDDDAISPNWVSDLLSIIEEHPEVAIAMAKQEVVDAAGQILGKSSSTMPTFLTADEFVQSWTQYGFVNYSTFLTRTSDIQKCGGFPDFTRGFHIEDAVILKLCLNRSVAFSQRCTFYLQRDPSSMTVSMDYRERAGASTQFLRFLEEDPCIRGYADLEPARWQEMKNCFIEMTWKNYCHKWSTKYVKTLSTLEWLKAAFAFPYIPDYYSAVGRTLAEVTREAFVAKVKKFLPGLIRLYRFFKSPMT